MSSHLADQLIQERVITFDQLKAALEEKKRTGQSLEEALVSLGYVSEFQIAQHIGVLYGVPPVDLGSIDIGEDVLKLIPKDFAIANFVVPICLKGSALVVALRDPSNLMLIDDLRFITGFNIEARVATERVIKKSIERLYRVSLSTSETATQVEEPSDVLESPAEEFESLCESEGEKDLLKDGGFKFFAEESKEAEDVIPDEPLEPPKELGESPSQPQFPFYKISQIPSDVPLEEEVYEINPEEVEAPPNFSQTHAQSLGEEEPRVYEISEEVEGSSVVSIPLEFMPPSQRGSQTKVYEIIPEEAQSPPSFILTGEVPAPQLGAEGKGVVSGLEPSQVGPQPSSLEADESVLIEFYSSPPQGVALEEVEMSPSQEASLKESQPGGEATPAASVQSTKEPPPLPGDAQFHPLEEPKKEAYRGTVMVVDDSPTVKKIVAITLEREGYRVVGVDNAMQALAKFEEFVPDVVLLDINLPYIDGYQLCKIIKGNPLTKNASVIMLTGKDGFLDKVRGKLAGAAEYITKPFQPNYLVEIVRKHTRGRL